MNVRFVVLALALALALPAAATAATYTDTITGYEYYATSSDGRFAGTASGALPGQWNADVQHTPLCSSCSPTATITGGDFSLATVLNGLPTLATGRFSGGTLQVTNVGLNCTNQTFAINGSLANVGRWNGGSGSGTFAATLTHYRHRVFGSCITYAASVTGSMSLLF